MINEEKQVDVKHQFPSQFNIEELNFVLIQRIKLFKAVSGLFQYVVL